MGSIKTGRGDLTRLFENHANSLRNLAAEGIHTLIYNFMPVLDWVLADMRWPFPMARFTKRITSPVL